MLEDTSFAIHPGQDKKIENSDFRDVGNAINIEQIQNGYAVVTDTGKLNILFYTHETVRFSIHHFGETKRDAISPAVLKKPEKINLTLNENTNEWLLSSDKLIIEINKSPVRLTIKDKDGVVLVREGKKGMGYKDSKEIICFKEMRDDDYFYGFGEKTGFLNKKGEKITMWNTDVYAPHNPETDPLYQSIPFFMTLNNGRAHGLFFDNTFKSEFNLQSETDHYSYSADGGQLDYYVFAGPTPKDVLEQYTDLTGRMPIPPKWAIGYHQSRYSYETEAEVREIAETFIEKGIPLDVIYLDIHYMDGYRVFTFDPTNFPNPRKLIDDLREKGIRIVPIVDPGVKEDPEYSIYQEGIRQDRFCKYIEGNVYFGDVWPGNSAFPDFTNTEVREWWGDKHKFYSDLGIEGIWNDMNEPAVFNETKTMDVKVMHDNDGDPKTHREMHNLYGLLMGEATYSGMKNNLNGKRPFLLTRAGYSGVQRYAAVWTGDNRSFWEHLQMSLPMVMNLGVSGVAFAGPDVGGFAHDSNGELLTRWTQVGAFTPYFRNHCAINFARQEPWSFGEKYETIIKKYIELRYQWLPQLYTLFAEAHDKGLPVMRPLFMEFPTDEKTYNLNDQFMIGNNTIIAPIMQPSVDHRSVYLPEGQWVQYWTDEVLEGGQYHLVHAPLDTLPIFIKKGTVIAHGEVKASTEIKDKKLALHLYYNDNSKTKFTLYDDDGSTFDYEKGQYIVKDINIEFQDEQVRINITNKGSYSPEWTDIEFIVHCFDKDQLSVIINDSPQKIMKNDRSTFSVSYSR